MRALFIALLFSAPTFAVDGACLLNTEVGPFSVPEQSRLKSLIEFSRLNKISLGIESTSGISGKTQVSEGAGVAATTIKAILGVHDRFRLECLNGAIVVSSQAVSRPRWLDVKIAEFRISRSTLGLANAALWMRTELALDSTRKGFAGSIPGDNVNELVGPFDLKNTTVRALLCRLVASSPGTTWAVGAVQEAVGASWTNRLWTLVPYAR